MNLLHKLFGTPPADPVVGQVWRSGNSGRCMWVTDVSHTDGGMLTVSTQYEYTPGRWTTPLCHYVSNIAGWRRLLRDEKRVLLK